MPYPSLTFADLLTQATRAELEHLVSLLQGYLSEQHKEDGSHSDITADSVDVSGDLSVDGTITADADGTPITLAPSAQFGPGVQLTKGTSSDWRVEATLSSALPVLSIRDVLRAASGDTGTVDVIRLTSGASSTYVIQPHASYIVLQLGQNASGQRIDEINVSVLRAVSNSFIGNGAHLSVGTSTYTGRATTNPTNAVNIYPGTVPVGNTGVNPFVTLYTKDAGAGVYKLYYMDSAGTEVGPLT